MIRARTTPRKARFSSCAKGNNSLPGHLRKDGNVTRRFALFQQSEPPNPTNEGFVPPGAKAGSVTHAERVGQPRSGDGSCRDAQPDLGCWQPPGTGTLGPEETQRVLSFNSHFSTRCHSPGGSYQQLRVPLEEMEPDTTQSKWVRQWL